jgi:hypothetical protein
MSQITLDRAAAILEAHGHQWAPSSLPGHIKGRVEWTHISGATGANWEDIELSSQAIRLWLGY